MRGREAENLQDKRRSVLIVKSGTPMGGVRARLLEAAAAGVSLGGEGFLIHLFEL
jgi:hypothetical protein